MNWLKICFLKPYPTLDASPKLEPVGKYKARLVKIYDGDTQTYVIKFHKHFYKINVRLLNIDTPEIRGSDKINAIKARNRVFEILTNSKCDDNSSLQDITDYLNKNEIFVTLITTKSDKYGRILGDVLSKQNINLSEQLLKEGLGVPYNGGSK